MVTRNYPPVKREDQDGNSVMPIISLSVYISLIHPRPIVKSYVIDQILEHLKEKGQLKK
jgi:hypothetical protein